MTGFELGDCDEINNLPDELLINIFKLLSAEEVVKCGGVCRRWRALSRDAAVWRRLRIAYSGQPRVTARATTFRLIATHGHYINCLKLQYEYDYSIVKTILTQCDNLTSLEVVMCRIAKNFEDDVIKWPNLRKLSLKNTLLQQNNDDLCIQYDQFKYLNYLALSEIGLNSANCDSLLRCRYLRQIYIEKIKSLDLDFVERLIQSKKDILETLHIYGGGAIDDHCLQLLAGCERLKDLAIIRCEGLTDAGLIWLTRFKSIQHLQIWNNVNFSEVNLLRTFGSPNLVTLQSLSLSRIGNISPVIVDVISEYYKNLKFLAVYQCPRIINTDYEKQLKSKFRHFDVVLY